LSLAMLKRRLFPQPKSPVPSRDRVATWLFSADDDPWPPSRELIDLGLAACTRAGTIDLKDIRRRDHCPPYFDIWPGEQYRLLSALVDVWRPQVVIEIGTFIGLSALCIRKHLPPRGRIVTFDINPWHSVDITCLRREDFEDGSMRQILADLSIPEIADSHRELLESADMIFLDGPHDGATESKMMMNFLSVNYKRTPLFVFDDIKLVDMLGFWRALPMAKLDLTSFGHWTGTGISMLDGTAIKRKEI
jgi:predicted O-methyltransferase YrrM